MHKKKGMKKLICTITLTAAFFVFSGCSKSSMELKQSIIGTWEMREMQAGMVANKQYAPGNGNMLKFSESTYEKYENHILIKTGTYSIVKDNTAATEVGLVITPGQFTHRIVFNDLITPAKTFFHISNNRLTLLSGYFPLDSGSNISYEKQ
jgi:hypothetical protein